MKLALANYRNEFEHFTLVFDLVRHSLRELGDAGFRRFMESARRPKEARLAKIITFINTQQPDLTDIVAGLQQRHRKEMSAKLPVTRSLKWAEYRGHAFLGLNGSELILRVARFEAFLKEIHMHALFGKPQLLSLCKPNRPIALKDIFRGGFERFKMSEIDRQVREADRLSVKEKAKFFARRLKLRWGADSDVARISELVELRHSLVHQIPTAFVSDKSISDARRLLLSVPQECFKQAAKIYPSHFKQ